MSSTTTLQLAAYFRVAAYSIAFFDYLQTLPAEYRLYSRQKGPLRLSAACVLFILVRYLGLLSIILGNTGFFYHGFSKAACDRYFWLTPVFKRDSCDSVGYSSARICDLRLTRCFIHRTYAVSRKSPLVLRILIGVFIACAVPEFISTFWQRIPFHTNNACTSGNPPGIKIASLYYVGGLVYDAVTMVLTTTYLWKFSNASRTSLSQLMKMMLEDGVMYFVALCSMNIVNIIFFQSPNAILQPAASTLGMAATMIFSGRFILNLSERASRDGISGEGTHSSRTPANPRGGNTVCASGADDVIAVRVMKSVITMNDMSRDDASESKAKGTAHGQWSVDEMA
ncbi:hypothetical protein DFH08DRAFT_937618 [Mycena albidolilacea]|uniref:DUF6533 domain-containing protein n=1 Tax=Mycena albidolilacea TaxID=1033008 RepID=A0AAD6ZXT9_9AGAR|nr:hypothetical protein DFH08DRAFT_937618 [Mycena albidolilacea]